MDCEAGDRRDCRSATDCGAADGADLWGLVSGDAGGELRAGKTAKAMLLGVPLLLGRKNDGKLFAMRDLCPHRGIPLSAGWFDGER